MYTSTFFLYSITQKLVGIIYPPVILGASLIRKIEKETVPVSLASSSVYTRQVCPIFQGHQSDVPEEVDIFLLACLDLSPVSTTYCFARLLLC